VKGDRQSLPEERGRVAEGTRDHMDEFVVWVDVFPLVANLDKGVATRGPPPPTMVHVGELALAISEQNHGNLLVVRGIQHLDYLVVRVISPNGHLFDSRSRKRIVCKAIEDEPAMFDHLQLGVLGLCLRVWQEPRRQLEGLDPRVLGCEVCVAIPQSANTICQISHRKPHTHLTGQRLDDEVTVDRSALLGSERKPRLPLKGPYVQLGMPGGDVNLNFMNQSGALPRQRFTGQARDGEAGLDDFNARAYQPLFGRLTRPDPVSGSLFAPQSWNAYAYVRNRPLVATDPSGMMAFFISYIDIWPRFNDSTGASAAMPHLDTAAMNPWRNQFNGAYFEGGNEFSGETGGSGVGRILRPSTTTDDTASPGDKPPQQQTPQKPDDNKPDDKKPPKKEDPCQAQATDENVSYLGISAFFVPIAGVEAAGGVFWTEGGSIGFYGSHTTGGPTLGLGAGIGLDFGRVKGMKNFNGPSLHLQLSAGPVGTEAYKTPDNRSFTGGGGSPWGILLGRKLGLGASVGRVNTGIKTVKGGACGGD
jgi:RHS repeat-associated protein